MYKILSCSILVLVLSGCAVISGQTKDGAKFKYSRLGFQSLDEVEIVKNETGTSFKLKKQTTDSANLAAALKNAAFIVEQSKN